MKIKMIETFSGIGAQHKALENLKFNKIIKDYEVLATSDWDVYSVVSYAAIHYPNFEKEIKTPSDDELEKWIIQKAGHLSKNGNTPLERFNLISKEEKILWYKAFKITNNIGSVVDSFERLKPYLKDANLLTYSFPCTDLSTAGNFHGFNEGITKGTRSGLLLEIEKVLERAYKHDEKLERERERERERLLPKYLLLENVPNLVSKQHRHSFDKWLAKLTKFGYTTYWGVINSHDFGLYQARKRVYALSILTNEKAFFEESLHKEASEIFKNEYKPKWMQTDKKLSFFFDFENTNKEESNWAQIKNTPSRIRMINNSPKITPSTKKLSTVTTKQDRLPNVGSLDYNNTRKDDKGISYTLKRFITPQEAYLMMGFEKQDYQKAKKYMLKLVSNNRINHLAREKLWKQAGNSIVVNVLETIFYLINKYETH